MNKLSLTIVNDKNLRGALAPAKTLSKRLLEDIVDFIGLSRPELVKELEAKAKEAGHKGFWIPAQEVERRLGIEAKAELFLA